METAATGFTPPSTNAVVGASLEHVLCATLDVDDVSPPAAAGTAAVGAADEEALLAAVRSRMLAYAVLLGTPANRCSLRIAAGVPAADPVTAARPLSMLEKDGQTKAARENLADMPDFWREAYRQHTEYLVADVPGTGMALGLSREMYAACAAYADQVRDMDSVAEDRMPVMPRTASWRFLT